MKAKDIALNVLAFLGLAVVVSMGQKIIFKLYEFYQHVIRGNDIYYVDYYQAALIQNVLIMTLVIFVGYLILKKLK